MPRPRRSRPDALVELARYRLVLRQNQLDSLKAYRQATPAQLGALYEHRLPIARLVEAADPDVLEALFGPLDWSAHQYSTHAGARGMSLVYDVGTDGERLVWIALRAALRARRS